MSFVTVAKTGEIPPGTMKHIEIAEKELCIANVEGEFYAIGDRCGHENASLAKGTLEGTLVICPMHSSKFDITTGKKVAGPVLELAGITKKFGGCPEHVRKEMGEMFEGITAAQSSIKTYDLPTYDVKIDGENVLVNV
ncbi:Rieske (2Fe-2S) protein [Methanosphaerula palustris]|uniref:Rieske (2Fe-2S) domain protein n=1 Tax=Methanosphaerula palustris (strain ATCC BAA-1556 / DSM 19958 / E1-9c) TaxID=521011 RepID=B8GHL1_METPE|nr:Rieske 2Fe-2S domain-containing protein [Methanosphaerula palustris]ACL16616.1 Rieske (2Fe-2S) domain protein [Methanosphaerula palustris E1-9c]